MAQPPVVPEPEAPEAPVVEEPVAEAPEASPAPADPPVPAPVPVFSPTPPPAVPPPAAPSFRQAMTAGVNRLATSLDNLDVMSGMLSQASSAVDDAIAQQKAAESQRDTVVVSVDDARADAVAAFDGLTNVLTTGRDAVANG